MEMNHTKPFVDLDVTQPIWHHFYMVAPLVVIGTKEGDGYDLAPKHMVTALGKENYFGFVCTPKHSTYQNIKREKTFTVSFPRPNQIILASLAASPRCGEDNMSKPVIDKLPTQKSKHIDALYLTEAYLYFDCQLTTIVDGFGEYSLIAGKIIAASVSEDSKKITEGDDAKMIYDAPLLAYLPHSRFSEIKQTHMFPLPMGME